VDGQRVGGHAQLYHECGKVVYRNPGLRATILLAAMILFDQLRSTAGFVDAGWDGQVTLELSNVANFPVTCTPV
jgi:hypothetical protein